MADPTGPGIVDGTENDDVVNVGFTDGEGDTAANTGAVISTQDGEDSIVAGAGDDTILAGNGADTVHAGAGDDEVHGDESDPQDSDDDAGDDYLVGGAGSDTIFGNDGNDTIYGGDDGAVGGSGGGVESFNWSEVGTPADGDPLGGPATQDTGSVTVSYTSTGGTSEFEDATQITGGLGGGSETPDANSGLRMDTGAGTGATTTAALEFSEAVEDAQFRINDIDGNSVTKIWAYDAEGNRIEVTLTAEDGSNLHLVDIDGDGTNEAAISDGSAPGDADDGGNSVLVTIPGPVARIEIITVNLDDDPADVTVSDVFFTTDGGVAATDEGDSLVGGEGDDLIYGNEGNDTIIGGAGADEMHGGDDADTFVITSPEDAIGDTIYGGSGGLDLDDIDLAGERGVDWRVTNLTTDSDGNGFDGTVEFLDGDGNVTGTMDFENIEPGITVLCFTPGTKILTPMGEVAVENLREGDLVVTRDNGLQPIRWSGSRKLNATDMAARPQLRPILIRQGSLGPNQPERDMMVSPSHRMLLVSEQAELLFEEREVLVAAKHLTHLDGVDMVDVDDVTYVHVMCEQHEVVLANGAWSESFQPGDYSMNGIEKSQREEIYSLFPELREEEGLAAYSAARLSLKRHEALLIA
ncbi:Nodulation protein O [Shimia sp. SK013]|uniref:Hint domain-containing protein n=1 Tax=Shimia sp. SK013 TaxID=1389006 RepID=UPI0006CD129A|nr:Hint domain-containing protein [Shimia sp. SK013]KPA23563.1 Nodulation protein O [Shimia sp. SK013]